MRIGEVLTMPKEYIEREALKEDLKESYDRLKAIYDGLTYDEDKQICAGQLTTFTEAILRVKEAPAADVAPVRHGHLISTGMDELWAEFGNCTECGGDNYIKAEFCNWCGAKLT